MIEYKGNCILDGNAKWREKLIHLGGEQHMAEGVTDLLESTWNYTEHIEEYFTKDVTVQDILKGFKEISQYTVHIPEDIEKMMHKQELIIKKGYTTVKSPLSAPITIVVGEVNLHGLIVQEVYIDTTEEES